MKRTILTLSAFVLLLGACGGTDPVEEKSSGGLSPNALATAEYAQQEYRDEIIDTMADLVRFRTVYQPGTANSENPEFLNMTQYLKAKAEELGMDFQDHGAVAVIGLGESMDRLGIVTHGDVQPADPSKWSEVGPFQLDQQSEPGRLIGRGTEDDKGPIAMALYAMKSLSDKGLPLRRRIELIISYTEESDWNPMISFLQNYHPPGLNIALDSKYPVVSAEKGFCVVQMTLPLSDGPPADGRPFLPSFSGGSFISQVPEDARAVLRNADADLQSLLEQAAQEDGQVDYSFQRQGNDLIVTALGRSAHSSEPEEGVNAITHLAALLGQANPSGNSAAAYVDFINRYVGTSYYAEKFGEIAYSHDFMGPMTLSLSTLKEEGGKHVLSINLRRPAGKPKDLLEEEIRNVVEGWAERNGLSELDLQLLIGDPHLVEDAPHVPVLLEVFSHFTGAEDPQALSAGGGTHARLLPNGVSFGPHWPGRPYSGHTEHEFLSLQELDLDIQMYTAMLVELAVERE